MFAKSLHLTSRLQALKCGTRCTTLKVTQFTRLFRERPQYQYFDNRGQTLRQRLLTPRMLIVYGGIGVAISYYVVHLENVEITGMLCI